MTAFADPHWHAQHQNPGGYTDRAWPAFLDVHFRNRTQRTFLAETNHRGPYLIQRPFYPEGGLCHGYLLHPPGGMVSGDHLELNLHSHTDTQALVTTPSAGKFYHRDTGEHWQTQHTNITVDANASLEHLPLETIFFNGCHARLQTTIDVAPASRFFGWETLCFGRPHSHEPFHAGDIRTTTLIRVAGQNHYRDQLTIPGDPHFHQARWGLNGYQTLSTVFCWGLAQESFENAQAHWHTIDTHNAWVSATYIEGLSIFRVFARNSEWAHHCLQSLWTELRPALLDRPAVAPRIWNT